ncbi:unnamed protein product [Toxocara canis]|uniref:Phage protein n=1 Tax=Toxocara canis TaxID=6265 RepID=A0A183U322_TOXCA|nr:unnamed protein product [Toxocara canis]
MRIPLTLSTLITVIESYFMNAPLNLGEKPILPPIRANSTHAIYFYDGVFRYEPLHAIVESAIETTTTDTEAINWYDGLNDGYSEQLEIDSANETANTNAVTASKIARKDESRMNETDAKQMLRNIRRNDVATL